jgi:hypothetical protein
METGVTLQINMAPSDLPHAVHTLPHQLRQWRGQVDEVLLTVDLRRSTGHYATAWDERLPGFLRLMQEHTSKDSAIHVREVDYSSQAREKVSRQFFGNQLIPDRDYMGAPFYAYFAGFSQARYDYILHMDSDMLFGGGSQTWLAEAIRLMQQRPEVVACNPLPGPPTADGTLLSQTLVPAPYTSPAFLSEGVSTRIIFFNRQRLLSLLAPLSVFAPSWHRAYLARLAGIPPYEPAESSLSTGARQKGVMRMDFLGEEPGMWALHPPYRSALFYERLPFLIRQIETDDIPEGQRGDHDLNQSMIDWGNAAGTTWQRQVDKLQLILRRFTPGLTSSIVSRAS